METLSIRTRKYSKTYHGFFSTNTSRALYPNFCEISRALQRDTTIVFTIIKLSKPIRKCTQKLYTISEKLVALKVQSMWNTFYCQISWMDFDVLYILRSKRFSQSQQLFPITRKEFLKCSNTFVSHCISRKVQTIRNNSTWLPILS